MAVDSPRQPEEQPAPGTALEPLTDQDPAAAPVTAEGTPATETPPDESAPTGPLAGRAGRRAAAGAGPIHPGRPGQRHRRYFGPQARCRRR